MPDRGAAKRSGKPAVLPTGNELALTNKLMRLDELC